MAPQYACNGVDEILGQAISDAQFENYQLQRPETLLN